MCGGKLAEGIDYKGEALKGVAVVGLPLSAYDEIQKEINSYYTMKYGKIKGMLIAYTLPAINRGCKLQEGLSGRNPKGASCCSATAGLDMTISGS